MPLIYVSNLIVKCQISVIHWNASLI